MPITPLHFGFIPVADKLTKGKMSATSFVLVNCLIDLGTIHAVIKNSILDEIDKAGEAPRVALHWSHDWMFVLLSIAFIAALGFRSKRWMLGAVIGGVSHLFLDALVHTDVNPLSMFFEANPLYIGMMDEISLVLLIGCVWWAAMLLNRANADLRSIASKLKDHLSKWRKSSAQT